MYQSFVSIFAVAGATILAYAIPQMLNGKSGALFWLGLGLLILVIAALYWIRETTRNWSWRIFFHGREEIIELINRRLSESGFKDDDFDLLWEEISTINRWEELLPALSFVKLRQAAEDIIINQSIPQDQDAFKTVATELSSLLNVHIRDDWYGTPQSRYVDAIRDSVALFLMMGATYLVVGGLMTDESLLLGSANLVWFLPLFLFTLFILILAGFEGLQISVAVLRLRDLGAVPREKYNKAVDRHLRFKDELSTNTFFAGRQLVVVVIVFLSAQLTSFPEMSTWPWTEEPFPIFVGAWLEPLLRLGIPGAIVVLWFGQLAPQYIANKYPVWFLNLPMMNWVLEFSKLVKAMGIARPSEWLSMIIKPQVLDIPISSKEKFKEQIGTYRRELHKKSHSFILLGVRKHWEIKRSDKANLKHSTIIKPHDMHFEEIKDTTLMFRKDPAITSINLRLVTPNGDSEIIQQLDAEMTKTPIGPSEWKKCTLLIKSNSEQVIDHKLGEVISTEVEAKVDEWFVDRVYIETPTSYILFSARVEDPRPVNVGRIEMIAYKQVGEERQFFRTKSQELDWRRDEGYWHVELVEFYPEIDAFYEFRWTDKASNLLITAKELSNLG